MTARAVPAGNGVQWLTSAAQLVFKNPAAFLLMGLIIGILSIIPLVNLLTIIAMPALYAGVIYAARKEDSGQPASVGDLFQGFQQPGKIGPLLMLCLPTIALFVVMLILTFVLAGGFIAALAGGQGSSAVMGAGFGAIILLFLLYLVGAIFVGLLMFFSIARVMFDGVDAFSAMKESLSASIKNIGAVLIAGVIIFGAAFVLMIIPILGPIAFLIIGMPIVIVTFYCAYKDVFGLEQSMSSPLQAPQPPMPPRPPTVQ
jgi:uncharacterized membrane protein